MPKSTSRINILNNDEISDCFGLPNFNYHEQEYYFSLFGSEKAVFNALPVYDKCYFVLQLGYFKAKKQFFIIDKSEVSKDIRFIVKLYNIAKPKASISEHTHKKIKAKILEVLDYKDDTKSILELLERKSTKLIATTLKPKAIFKELYEQASNSKHVMPKYSAFQTIIGQAIKNEEIRLQNIINNNLPKYARALLNKLLSNDSKYYEITISKKDQKNFKYKEAQKTILIKEKYNKIYNVASKTIPKLGITKNMVDYYASLADYYTVAKLKKLPAGTTYLYLLCYIYRRIQKINDDLSISFDHYVGKYKKLSTEYAKDYVFDTKNKFNNSIRTKLPKVLSSIIDSTVDDSFLREEIFSIIPKQDFPDIIKYIKNNTIDENHYKWHYYEINHNEIIKNIRPLFNSIDFEYNNCDDLCKAANFLKDCFNNNTLLTKVDINKFPLEFIPKSARVYIFSKNIRTLTNVFTCQYEFCVYDELCKKFKINEVAVPDSISHKSLHDDLIPKHKRKSVIKELNNPRLSESLSKQLKADKKVIDDLFYTVNKRIETGENKSVKVEKRNGETKLILQYNKKEDLTNHGFFLKIPRINLIEILKFASLRTSFLDGFTHIKPYNSSNRIDHNLLLAVVLANGTHHGTNKITGISDLKYNDLKYTEDSYMRLETIRLCNDILCRAIVDLSIFPHWNISKELIYGSVDAQKFKTRIEVLSARNSAKYFPQKKGVCAYTLLANYVPLSTEIISPNLHESYFLVDIILNMLDGFNLDIITGDSHSKNAVNFFLTRYVPVDFQPCLTGINTKFKNLCSFEHPNKYKDLLIKPKRQIKADFIASEQENIELAVASLLQGEIKQSIIVKKLSSLSTVNSTCKAIKEYNDLLDTIYYLKYIDSAEHRQFVRGSQNRIEAYHQLRRAVILGNNGEFRGNSEAEISVWNECARLLANAMIYYNGCLLSSALSKYTALGDNNAVKIIKNVSPIAWNHINMIGKLEFMNKAQDINIDNIIAEADIF